jgi:uncharacterized protein YjcR
LSDNLVTTKYLADFLRVSVNQVHTWHSRREKNGFPEPRGTAASREGRRGGPSGAPLFDLSEVVAWYARYEPRRGGAPKGNRNNTRRRPDGRFA